MLCRQDMKGMSVLEDQVADRRGQPVKTSDAARFVEEEVLPGIKPTPETIFSQDGVERRKYRATIDMVPEHLKLRAEKYLPVVKAQALRFRIKPQLVLAVMHTESYFNPWAVSRSNAVGIMQLIPRFAAREAYRNLYKRDKVLSPDHLFDPENNIELGCAYLSLLRYSYFKDISGETKNRYIALCGYNWGPTVMRKRILNKYRFAEMPDDRVYEFLTAGPDSAKIPDETRNYLKQVVERMRIYEPFFL